MHRPYVPQRPGARASAWRRGGRVFVGHRGCQYASAALMDPITKAFLAGIHHFVAVKNLGLVHFGKERKDDVT
jgi:hypothetical protein